MIDIHAPHERTHSWTDFLIHIATIVVGLFIAIGLEQTVELIHRSHQRHQLEADLRIEAENNRGSSSPATSVCRSSSPGSSKR